MVRRNECPLTDKKNLKTSLSDVDHMHTYALMCTCTESVGKHVVSSNTYPRPNLSPMVSRRLR